MKYKKIVVASDSFKGSLRSKEVGACVMETLLQAYPNLEVVNLPIADGGEGLTEALTDATQGIIIDKTVSGPLSQNVEARYGISADGLTAIIEMASASGLSLVPKDQRNPMITTTYGTGELIADALDRGCRNFLIGIGGSATNDAGIGMLQALGFKFYSNGHQLPVSGGELLAQIDHIDSLDIHPMIDESTFIVACDVKNPMCGSHGAAYVYGAQKGATPEMIKLLDRGVASFADLLEQEWGRSIKTLPGAGAAGGMGGSMVALLNATLKPGIDMVLDFLHFHDIIAGADLIITGEGAMDRLTLMGKAPIGVLRAAQKQHIPIIAIAGRIEDRAELEQAGFETLIEISPRDIPIEEAMKPAIAKAYIQKKIKQYIESVGSN